MRIWMCEGEGGPLLTDEQLLALIASAGSLSAALEGGDELKVDGSFAIAWTTSLDFRIERSGKTLVGSAASGEGLVNAYSGEGRVILAPVALDRSDPSAGSSAGMR